MPLRRSFEKKEEEALMLRLELRFRNNQQNVTNKMMEFLPGKINKQLRDKRNITAYKRRL